MAKVKWGVLGVAKIATEKVIPAMQRGNGHARFSASPRATARARPRRRKSSASPSPMAPMRTMLADPEIEAIYNPLPNELHVPWTEKALAAGKHVLCEKPIALDAKRSRRLIAARDKSGKLVAEAFMVRFHPQWRRAQEIVRVGRHRRRQRDPDPVRLSPARRRQHPQQAAGRRRALRHRLLRDPDRAIHFRRRADPRRRGARHRSEFRHRPAGERLDRISRRPASDLQRRDAARQRAARRHRRHAPGASKCRCRSTRRSTGRRSIVVDTGADLVGGGAKIGGIRGLRSVHAAGRRVFARHPGRGASSNFRSRTRSPTCASSTPASARRGTAPG